MVIDPGLVENLVQQLKQASLRSEGTLHFAQFEATRVGRNAVWKVLNKDNSDLFYVKFFSKDEWYERELFGRNLVEQIGKSNARCIYSRVEHTCNLERYIISNPIHGVDLSETLKQAYRIDRNPFKRMQRIKVAEKAMLNAIGFLEVLHNAPTSNQSFLYDHTLEGVAKRIEILLDRMFVWASASDRQYILDIKEKYSPTRCRCQSRKVLVFGDVTLGNFFWSDESSGAVDFEDIGIGSPSRDFVLLRYYLQKMHGNRFYFKKPSLVKLLENYDFGCKYCENTFVLELNLHQYEVHRKRSVFDPVASSP